MPQQLLFFGYAIHSIRYSDKFILYNGFLAIFVATKTTMFSKACEYGIRATLHIARQSQGGHRVSLKDIAGAIDSPVAFTAKILQQLVHANVIHSLKGPHGGFEMTPHQLHNVRLSHIVSAIDGDQIYRGCGLGLKACNELKPCPLHDQFKDVRDKLQLMLETTSVSELAAGLTEGLTFLKQ